MKEEVSDLFSCDHCDSTFVTRWSLESHTKAFHPQSKVSPTITPTQPPAHQGGVKRGRKWEEEAQQLPKSKRRTNFPCQLCNNEFHQDDELTLHLNTVHSEVTITLTTPKPNITKPKPRVSLLKSSINNQNERNGEIKTKIKMEPMDADVKLERPDTPPLHQFNPLQLDGNFEITEVVRTLLISHMNAETGREAEAAAAAKKSSIPSVRYTPISSQNLAYPQKSDSDDEDDEFEGEGSNPVTCQEVEVQYGQGSIPLVTMGNVFPGQFPCLECGATFSKDYQLERHMEYHNAASRPHKCLICGDSRGFARKEHLSKHMSSVHSGMKFTCEFCGKDISRRDHLVRHIRSVHRCPIPPGLDLLAAAASNLQAVSTSPSLTVTQLDLDEISDKTLQSMQPKPKKPYTKCDMCSETFTQLETLFQHQRDAHSDIRKYNCEFCSKSFKRREHLEKHRVLHTGEKKFTCEHCVKSFPRRDALQDHLRRIHGALNPTDAEEFPCSLCDKIFFQHSNLVRHRNQVHNITLAVAIANGGRLFGEDGNERLDPLSRSQNEINHGVMDINVRKLKRPPLPGLLPIQNFSFVQSTTRVGKN